MLGTLERRPWVGFRAPARAVDGISDSMLSERLGELCDAGAGARTVTEGAARVGPVCAHGFGPRALRRRSSSPPAGPTSTFLLAPSDA